MNINYTPLQFIGRWQAYTRYSNKPTKPIAKMLKLTCMTYGLTVVCNAWRNYVKLEKVAIATHCNLKAARCRSGPNFAHFTCSALWKLVERWAKYRSKFFVRDLVPSHWYTFDEVPMDRLGDWRSAQKNMSTNKIWRLSYISRAAIKISANKSTV